MKVTQHDNFVYKIRFCYFFFNMSPKLYILNVKSTHLTQVWRKSTTQTLNHIVINKKLAFRLIFLLKFNLYKEKKRLVSKRNNIQFRHCKNTSVFTVIKISLNELNGLKLVAWSFKKITTRRTANRNKYGVRQK